MKYQKLLSVLERKRHCAWSSPGVSRGDTASSRCEERKILEAGKDVLKAGPPPP